MSNTNANAAKTNNSAKKEISSINLKQFASKLQDVKIAEIRKKDRLYIYPEKFNDAMINGREGKNHRSSLRNKLQRFCNNVFVYTKTNEIELLQKEVKEFLSFYKENYFINDFSVNSLTNKPNEKSTDLNLLLDIVKEFQKQPAEKKKTIAKKSPVKKDKKIKDVVALEAKESITE